MSLNARIEHCKALGSIMTALSQKHTELVEQFSDRPAFARWLAGIAFAMTSYGSMGRS
jgi:hypothetical protein